MEYAFLIALVVAAIIAMQVYIKRGMQGNLRASAKQINPSPYVPGETTSTSTTTITGASIERSSQVSDISTNYPHEAVSREYTTASFQETSPIGVGAVATKSTTSSTQSTREGQELTDNEFLQP
jgi:hypothetical protein